MRYLGLNFDTGKAVKINLQDGWCILHKEDAFDKEMVHLTSSLIFHCFSPDLIFILGNQVFTDVIHDVNVIMVFLLLSRVNTLGK